MTRRGFGGPSAPPGAVLRDQLLETRPEVSRGAEEPWRERPAVPTPLVDTEDAPLQSASPDSAARADGEAQQMVVRLKHHRHRQHPGRHRVVAPYIVFPGSGAIAIRTRTERRRTADGRRNAQLFVRGCSRNRRCSAYRVPDQLGLVAHAELAQEVRAVR